MIYVLKWLDTLIKLFWIEYMLLTNNHVFSRLTHLSKSIQMIECEPDKLYEICSIFIYRSYNNTIRCMINIYIRYEYS